MNTQLSSSTCWICGRPILTSSEPISAHGAPVHLPCDVLRIALAQSTVVMPPIATDHLRP
ncbi:MAG TPA: hypothetical protein VJQ59_13100 [Candidatus Sulfotelmatobacter sp.]|nr:hypothetical protein [Candidatus Sulfotelmatobacter sp.]